MNIRDIFKINKSNIYLMIIVAIVSSFITVFCYWFIQHSHNNYSTILTENTDDIGIERIDKINYNISDFSILTIGTYNGVFNKSSLKDLQVYEIKAKVIDDIYVNENTYIGVRIKDILNSKNISNFGTMVVGSSHGLQISYNKNEITDDLFLVFEKNGIRYSKEEPVALLNPNIDDRNNITNVVVIQFQ